MPDSLLRAAIVDDEPLARRGIRQLLAAHTDVSVVAECRDGEEAVRMLERETVNLLFLDIQMPGLTGFDVLRRVLATRGRDAVPPTIFLTAYEEFALDAFEVEAVDYLVKPVNQERFDSAVARVRRRQSSGAESLDDELRYARHVVIHGTHAKRVIPVDEILWIGADDYYASIHTRERRYLLRETMASLEARLDPSQFARVHRGAIVNLAMVREIRSVADETVVVLRDATRVPVSRRRRSALAKLVTQAISHS